MNKQEALEAVLEDCRVREVAAEESGQEAAVALAGKDIVDLAKACAQDGGATEESLRLLGGAVLYLMVDEVEPVVGMALDAWLKKQETGIGPLRGPAPRRHHLLPQGDEESEAVG